MVVMFFSKLEGILENKHAKYIIAVDKSYEENFLNDKNEMDCIVKYYKQFSYFDKLTDYEKYCNVDKNCYEVCNNKNRKIYFDIDNIELSNDECIEYIEKFIKLVSELLQIENDYKQYLVKVNEGDIIKSIHIINTKYYMNYEDNKLLSTYINESQDKYIVDLCVYNENQQFRNINQSKLSKKIKNVVLNHKYTFKDSLISYTNKLSKVYFNKVFFIKKHNHIELDTTELMNIVINDFNENITFDNEFFNNNNDWKTATKIIKHYKIYDMDLWNKLSIEKATDTFLYKDNEDFINNINDKIIYGISKLYYLISKYSNYSISPTNKLHYYITEYIETNFNNDKEIIQEIQNEKKDLLEITNKQNQGFKLDCYNGFLFENDICKGNIFYDTIKLNEEKIFTEVKTIEEAKEKLCDFFETDKKIYTLKSCWGTGKTFMIINHTLQHYENEKILMITESNSLNNKLSKEYGFISHLDKQKNSEIDLSKCKKVVCSIQSINKLEKARYDIIIIDEFESVLNAYSSYKTFKNVYTTDKNYNETAYNIFLNKIKSCNKCLCLDADIEENKIKLFIDYYGKEEMVIYKNIQNPYKDYKFKLYYDEKYINSNLHNDIMNNKKIVISWAKSVKQANEIIKELCVNKITLFINVEGCFLHKNNEIKVFEKKYVIENIENFIIENEVDIWIYTPTIKTGISFNKPYFDKFYGYSNNNTLIVKEFLQTLYRARIFKDKEYNVYLQHYKIFNQNKKLKKNLSLNEIKRLFNSNEELYNYINKDKAEDIYITKNKDTPYYDLQVLNTQNIINSSKLFTYNFIELIKYHELDYEYCIDNEKYTEYDIQRNKALEAIDFYETKLLSKTDYERLKNEKQNKYDSYSIDEQQIIKKQYDKTSNLQYLYNGYDRIPNYLMGIDLSYYKEEEMIQSFKGSDLYKHYEKYIHNKGKDTIKNIRNVLNERIDNNELVNIMDIDNHKLNMLCIHNVLILLKYDFSNDFCILNQELKQIFKENYDFINIMYKKFSNEIFSIETNEKGFKEIYRMFKKLFKMIDINFSYKVNETNTTKDKTKIYIQPIYNIEKENALYNYECNKFKTLKQFENQSNIFIIDNNNTEYIDYKKLLNYEERLSNNKRISNEIKEQIRNNLILNDKRVSILPTNKINKDIKPTYLKSSYYNENLNFIDKSKVDKKGFINKKDKKKLKVYSSIITKWNNNEPIQDLIYRAYEPKHINIETTHYENNVYDLNVLEEEYNLYTSLLNNITTFTPKPITICN